MRQLWLWIVLGAGCGSAPDVPTPTTAALSVPDEPLGGRERWLELPSENGGKLLVHEAGDAHGEPPLLLVHGLGIGSREFARVFVPLSRKRKVLAFDLPGFGRSMRGGSYTPERYARVLDELVELLGYPQVDLLGHSMGGAISILYASRRPERVRRLVLADVAGILHRDALVTRQLEQKFENMAGGSQRLKRAMIGPLAPLGRTLRALGPDLDPFTRYHILDGSPGTASAIALIQYDFGSALAAVTASTLLLWGELDEVAPVRTADLLYDRLPATRLVLLDRVGHVPMVEAPEMFVSLVEQFLGPVAAPRATAEEAADQGEVLCRDRPFAHFTGRYRKLDLLRCPGAVLRDVHTQELAIRKSDAELSHVTVKAGMHVEDSSLVITGGELSGQVALSLSGSRVDAAGVVLRGSEFALVCHDTSRLLYSVSRLESPRGTVFEHGERVCSNTSQ